MTARVTRSAVYRTLVRNGLIEPASRRRSRKDYRRWERGAAMELWQLDVTASAFLTEGGEQKIVTGVDDHSRFCVIATALMRATARRCAAFVTAILGRPDQPARPIRRHPDQDPALPARRHRTGKARCPRRPARRALAAACRRRRRDRSRPDRQRLRPDQPRQSPGRGRPSTGRAAGHGADGRTADGHHRHRGHAAAHHGLPPPGGPAIPAPRRTPRPNPTTPARRSART